MHPTNEQLLAFRDSPQDAYVATHLEQCKECASLVQSASGMQSAMRDLPQLDPPADAWMRIAAASAARTRTVGTSHVRARAVVAFALAAGAAVFTVLFLLRNATDGSIEINEPETHATTPQQAATDALAVLIEQSRELDVLLQKLPERPRVERVSTAATLDTIEERIQWLDFQLSYAAAGELDEAEAQRLWRERVELMDSLVKVRYAQSGRVSF